MADSPIKATKTNGRPLCVFFMADHLGHPGDRVHGGTTYFLNTLPPLHRTGVQLTVCFMQPRHPMAEILEAAGIQPHFLGLGKHSPRSLTAFIPLLERSGADVVHLHSVKSRYAGLRAAHARGIASSFTITLRYPSRSVGSSAAMGRLGSVRLQLSLNLFATSPRASIM